MDLKLMDKYVALCREFNKPITWVGLRYFKKSLDNWE